MKKLIFRKFTGDTMAFFLTSALIMGLIVWTLQAVNYFDYVTQDGHGLKIYFLYTIFNFPKIIHRILPFIFFISLFYTLIHYETKNELSIFWINGVSKINFFNKVIYLSLFLMLFQIFLGSYVSPKSQLKAREYLRFSNVDFFTSLIKEGKFINAVKGLTIFIEKKNDNGLYSNIYLDDSTKNNSRSIHAKSGILVENDKTKIFRLFNGQVINNEKSKINVFKFDQIDFNLSDFTSNTITVPKIQEIPSLKLFDCLSLIERKFFSQFVCEKSLMKEIKQELLKRFYKPLYIPIIAILSCFLILTSRSNVKYERNKRIIFLITFLILIMSEASLRYSTISNFSMSVFLIIPWILFFLIYVCFYRIEKNV
tara:strand:- start:354 stop:1457 length:1104 start_codon:yes stop_codon:yes gene_type:complete